MKPINRVILTKDTALKGTQGKTRSSQQELFSILTCRVSCPILNLRGEPSSSKQIVESQPQKMLISKIFDQMLKVNGQKNKVKFRTTTSPLPRLHKAHSLQLIKTKPHFAILFVGVTSLAGYFQVESSRCVVASPSSRASSKCRSESTRGPGVGGGEAGGALPCPTPRSQSLLDLPAWPCLTPRLWRLTMEQCTTVERCPQQGSVLVNLSGSLVALWRQVRTQMMLLQIVQFKQTLLSLFVHRSGEQTVQM